VVRADEGITITPETGEVRGARTSASKVECRPLSGRTIATTGQVEPPAMRASAVAEVPTESDTAMNEAAAGQATELHESEVESAGILDRVRRRLALLIAGRDQRRDLRGQLMINWPQSCS
jgi:hypothetical protein